MARSRTQSHQLRRPLDPCELYFALFDEVSTTNFVLVAELRTLLDPNQVQQALGVVLREVDLLQVGIYWTTSGAEFRHQEDVSMPLQVINSTEDRWLALIERETTQPFQATVAPLARCLLIRLEERCVLAITFHHAIADAKSGVETLRRVLECVAVGIIEPRPMIRTPRTLDSYPTRFRPPEDEDQVLSIRSAALRDAVHTMRRYGAAPELTWFQPSQHRTARVVRVVINPEQLRQISAAARRQSTTVHAAICAAQLLATLRHLGHERAALFLTCPVDLRPHLGAARRPGMSGVATSFVSGTVGTDSGSEFWDLARSVASWIRTRIERGEAHLFYKLSGIEEVTALEDGMSSVSDSIDSMPSGIAVSNIGRVASFHAGLEVDSVSYALCPSGRQSMFLAAATYDERLVLNFAYNTHTMSESDAERLVSYSVAMLRHCGQNHE